ncbi:hypothetical protein HSIEG1_2813 [Enterococcus sp. HSIEG1]|nr:hypothetical protein HSIEG1_2813 [Enterococcus sp. HSIEG1]
MTTCSQRLLIREAMLNMAEQSLLVICFTWFIWIISVLFEAI